MTSMHGRERVADVVVVGSRCAGAATAMLLARLGHDVVAVDRAHFPSDTLSTHSVARGGMVQLSRWGLLPQVMASGAPAIREVSFHAAGQVMTRPIKDRAGVAHLVAPRRHVLDEILVDAARDAGADIRTGISVTGVTRDGDGRVSGVVGRSARGEVVTVPARFVVGADGLRSRIARAVPAPVVDQRHRDGAVWYAYFSELGFSGTEFHLGSGLFAGLFPTHAGEANVWVCGPTATIGRLAGEGRHEATRRAAFVDLVHRAAPALGPRLRQARQTSPVRGFPAMPNQRRQPVGQGWALVGDAGYFRDAITGHGITDAFRDAELLARSLDQWLRGEAGEADALARYHAARDRMVAELFELAVRLARQPPLEEFVELQKRLSAAIEAEAEELASWPAVPAHTSSLAA